MWKLNDNGDKLPWLKRSVLEMHRMKCIVIQSRFNQVHVLCRGFVANYQDLSNKKTSGTQSSDELGIKWNDFFRSLTSVLSIFSCHLFCKTFIELIQNKIINKIDGLTQLLLPK